MTLDPSAAAREQALFISFPEPLDAREWERLAASAPGQQRATGHTETATITLDVALRALNEGERAVVLTDNLSDMAEHVAFCLSVGGWEAVRETYVKLGKARAFRVQRACYEQARRLVDNVIDQLELVEGRARAIIEARLATARLDLVTSAQTWLALPQPVGTRTWSQTRSLLHSAPKGLPLRPGEHLVALRALLEDLQPLNRAVAAARKKLKAASQISTAVPAGTRLKYVTPAEARLHEALTRRALRVRRDSGRWPLVAWLTDLDPEVSDADLAKLVVAELKTVADAQLVVSREVRKRAAWIGIEELTAAQSRLGLDAPSLPVDDLRHNPFTTNMRAPLGPWRFPLAVAAALDELGLGEPSPVAGAVREVLRGETATGLVFVLNGGIAAASMVFPPAGIVLGATMATWNLMVDLDDTQKADAGYRAVIDPARSLAVPPGVAGVVAGVLGVAGSVVPGWSGLALGMAEATVRITAVP